MANSAIVGVLRVLLTADTAEFDTAMKRGAESAKVFSRDMTKIGAQATQLGSALTKTLTVPLLGLGVGTAKLAMDFESSFAGVRKTVQATEAEFQQMSRAFRELSKTIPINVNELNRLGEAAGALGIPKAEIVDFARVMSLLGVTTNVTADQAAESIAKIQNIFGAAGQDTERFASTLVDLGNKGASTESQILEMATRVASAGNTIGLTQGQVLGFSAAIANVGMEAEAGGSAMSRVMNDISVAVSHGGEAVQDFARVAGKSNEEFIKLFKTDAAEAITQFIEGLGRIKASGGDLILTLEQLGFKEIRQSDLLRRLAGNSNDLRIALSTQADAWSKNNALAEEARKRFETVESKLTLLWNRLKDVGITFGNALLPTINATIRAIDQLLPLLTRMADWFAALPEPVQATAVGLGLAAAAAGPLIYTFGQLAISAGAIAKLFTTTGLLSGLSKFFGVAGSGAMVMQGLSAAFRIFMGPVGWVIGVTSAILTATHTWDELFRILKAIGSILTNVVTAAFREFFIPIGKGVLGVGASFLGWMDRVAGGIMPLSDRVKFLGRAFEWTMGKVADLLEGLALLGGVDLPKLPASPNIIGAGPTIQDPSTAWDEMNRAETERTQRQNEATEATKKHAEAVKTLVDRLGGQEAISAARLWMEALPRIGGLTRLSAKDQEQLNGILQEALDAYRRLRQEAPATMRDLALATSALVAQNRALGTGLGRLPVGLGPSTFDANAPTVRNVVPGLGTGPAAIPKQTFSVGSSLFDGLNLGTMLPQSILAALTGGGNVVRAAAGTLGAKIGENVVTKFGEKITGLLGKTIGGALNSILPGIGALAGPLIEGLGKLFGKLFGGTAGRDALRSFASTEGGFDALHDKLNLLGADGERLWISLTQGVGRNDAEGAKRAIGEVSAALEQLRGSILQAGEVLSGVQTRMGTLTALTPELQAALDTALNAKNPQEYLAALQNLNGLLDQQDSKQQELDATLQKYGISWTDAGEKAKQAKLNQIAQGLLKDFNLLRASGMDVNAQMRAMGPNINQFVKDAKQAGVEVPQAMMTVIQTAIDAGEVFDENGTKITDMSQLGLTFGVTMQEATASIAQSMSKLELVLEGLAKFLGVTLPGAAEDGAQEIEDALNGIKPKTIKVGWKTVELPSQGITYGEGRPDMGPQPSPPGFAGGSGGIRDFGAGTVAVLHGREGVFTEDQLAALTGGRAPVTVNLELHVDGVFSEGDLVQTIQRRVMPIITQTIEDNVNGARTNLRDGLGVTTA